MQRRIKFSTQWLFACLLLSLVAVDGRAQPPAAPGESRQASSEHFAAGNRAFADQDFERALAEFLAAIETGSDGPAAHYNVAVCYYQLGDYLRAEESFRRLGRRFPAMRNLADYNLGLTLIRQEREAEARNAFVRAERGSDERIAALAAQMLARIPSVAAPRPSTWMRLIDLGLGHDDNVALVDSTGIPAGRSRDSTFSEVFAYFSGPVMPSEQWRLDASAYLVDYPDASDFDQRSVYLAGRYEWQAGDWRFAAGPHIGHSTLDGDGFEQRIGASFGLRYALDGRVTLALEWTHDDLDDLEPRFAYVAGERDQLTFVVDSVLESARLVISYRLENNDRASPGVTADRDRYAIRYRRTLNALWTGQLRYEYRVSDYGQLAPPREEKRHELDFELTRNLPSSWQFVAQFRYADNDSSDVLYAYDRQRLAAGISKLF